jgi:hypothetical protein
LTCQFNSNCRQAARLARAPRVSSSTHRDEIYVDVLARDRRTLDSKSSKTCLVLSATSSAPATSGATVLRRPNIEPIRPLAPSLAFARLPCCRKLWGTRAMRESEIARCISEVTERMTRRAHVERTSDARRKLGVTCQYNRGARLIRHRKGQTSGCIRRRQSR